MLQRLIGVITLNRNTYREIAHDTTATPQAALVVIFVTLIVGAIAAMGTNTDLPGLSSAPRYPIMSAVLTIVQQLLIWLAGSWVIAAVAKGFFKGKTDTGEMLRVFGYSRVFQVLLILGVLGGLITTIVSIVGSILGILGTIIGIREACGFTTTQAVITALFAILLVSVLIGFLFMFVLNPFVTLMFPI